jgi:phage terminase large subunit-like protein
MELIFGRPIRLRRARCPLKEFCPHAPWLRQQTFLSLPCLEAFYGGAAAGGKSEALLMAALQYVHVPGYAALILRKDTQRLRLSGGLIPRSHEWLAGKGPRWNSSDRRWLFPDTGGAPASISFGYLLDSNDRYRYGSSEYQYIAFDELTEFSEDDYLFLFSRLRRTSKVAVPLRMRAASNPGNVGHLWVKNRFVSAAASGERGEGLVLWNEDRAFVPARIRDNPAVDESEYRRSLLHLPPVYRERLMNGDWSICEEGLIHQDWLRYYTHNGGAIELRDRDDGVLARLAESEFRRLATVDPAGTSADRARERRGRAASWSVIQVWDYTPPDRGGYLVLRDAWRQRVGFDGLVKALQASYAQWRPARILIEREKLGQAAVDVLGEKLPIECVSTGGSDKVARAGPLINKLSRGEVFLPKYNNAWLGDLQAEWLSWTGLPGETCDQIDAAAYAAAESIAAGSDVVPLARVHWK